MYSVEWRLSCIFRPFDAAVSHTIIAHLSKGNIEMADKIKE